MSTAKKEASALGLEPGSREERTPKFGEPNSAQDRKVERLETFEARIGHAPEPAASAPQSFSAPPRHEPEETPICRTPISALNVPRRRVNASALKFSLKASDVVWVMAIIMTSIWTGYIGANNKTVLAPVTVGLFGTFVFIVTLLMSGAHRFHVAESYIAHQKKVFFAGFSALGVWLSTALILRPDSFLPDTLAFAGLMATITLFILHSMYYAQVRHLHDTRALSPNIVMLGATDSARRIIEQNAKNRELNILSIFDDRLSRAPAHIHGVPVVGKVEDLLAWDELPYIDRIVVTLPGIAEDRKKAFIEKVHLLPNRIAFVVDEFETLDHVRQRLSEIAEVGIHEVSGKPKSGRQVAQKRMVDFGVSLAALIVFAPVLAIVALLIKLDSPGPVLFTQDRHGFNNRIFKVYKFRSLRVEAEDKQAAKQVKAGDDRVTKIGRFIRKTSLDELPQLLNVLKGDMSLVGPRPHAVGMRTGNTESYKLVEDYAHRHKVKPGMTGWAQINGSRGPLHDAASVARRVELDVEYIERASIWFDFMIMFKTIPCLLGDSENIR